MLVPDLSGAQIEIILASNDPVQIGRLRRDLTASKFAYFFVILSDHLALLAAAARQITANDAQTPMVFVIDYKFAESVCDEMLQYVCSTSHMSTIECVVINPPTNAALRHRLLSKGARLFEGDTTEMAQQITRH
jgi:hypothetical protein